MENKENKGLLMELLTKRRKLADLRETITSHRMHSEVDGESNAADSPFLNTQRSIPPLPFSPLTPIILKTNTACEKLQCNSNPADSPFSSMQGSIPPPPFSPLTPIMLKTNTVCEKLQCESNPNTPLLDVLNAISPPLYSPSTPMLLRNINNEPPSSPVPAMSPETQQLYNVLIEDPMELSENSSDIIENSDNSDLRYIPYAGDSDDSVKDPDFIINNKKMNQVVDDSHTDINSEEDTIQEILNHDGIQGNEQPIHQDPNILKDNNTGRLRQEKDMEKRIDEQSRKESLNNEQHEEIERDIHNEQSTSSHENSSRSKNHVVELMHQPDTLLNSQSNEQNREENVETIEKTGSGLTKAGNPRKRRKFDMSVDERQSKKKQEFLNKYSLKNPCNSSCKKKCTTKVTEEQRKRIHEQYINLSWEQQGLFIKCLVEEKQVARRIQSNTEGNPKRMITYCYFFKVDNLPKVEVCKIFFLTTLGYNARNDSRLITALKKPIDCQKYERGRYTRNNKIDKEIIKKHIMSYGPSISHYRREHAPKKLYLPSDLTITFMHKQFLQEDSVRQISFEFYRQVVTENLNISFAHLGNEECEQCAYFKMHNPQHYANPEESCEICMNHLSHKVRYRESRAEYKKDVDLAAAADNGNNIYYSVDLQKVVMLPRMDQFKAAIFCPRIIVFNESFVPLGSTNNRSVPYAAVWNETVSGRRQEDIMSAFHAFLVHKRDAEHITLWLDNCSAQNKNWALLSYLVYVINSSTIAAKTITIKYFEPGHTYMSADAFHHQVELSMKRKTKLYDFDDFVDSVRLSNSKKNYVKVMAVPDFFDWQDPTSQHKLRSKTPRIYLKDIVSVMLEKGLFYLKYRSSHNADYQILDFLQAKVLKTKQFPELRPKEKARGITQERKKEIIEKLLPLMPENRKIFWRNLPVSSTGVDCGQEETETVL